MQNNLPCNRVQLEFGDQQAAIVQSQIDDAVARGAQLLAGGRVEHLGGGLYLRPTVLADVTADMSVMTEETFGPVIPVTIFNMLEEVLPLQMRAFTDCRVQ